MIFSIFVPGLPIAWKRAERNRYTGRTYHNDKDGKREAWKQAIVLAWLERYAGEGFPDGAYQAHVCLHFPRPKSHYKNGKLRANAPKYHTSKPDCDNLIKIVLDGMVNAELIPDDRYCVSEHAEKHWCHPGNEGMNLRLIPLE